MLLKGESIERKYNGDEQLVLDLTQVRIIATSNLNEANNYDQLVLGPTDAILGSDMKLVMYLTQVRLLE